MMRVEPCLCGGSIGVLAGDLVSKYAAEAIAAAVRFHYQGAVHQAWLDRGGIGFSSSTPVPTMPAQAIAGDRTWRPPRR